MSEVVDAAAEQMERYGAPGGVAGAELLLLVRARPAAARHPRPVLLLHGSTLPGSLAYTLAFEGRSWLGDLAARGFDAWALDVRGYGGSWRPADGGVRPSPPVADTAQAVVDVGLALAELRRLTGAELVDLVGWSWGASVAAAYVAAAEGGGGVGRLVLHAPQWLRDTPSPMVTSQTMAEPYRDVDADAFVARWFERASPAAVGRLERWRPTLAAALAAAAPIRVPNGSARDIAATWMAGRPGYDPAAIRVPTAVIVGAADADTPPALARTLFGLLGTDAKTYIEVPQGTHFTVLEPARDELFRATADFLADPAASRQQEPTP